MGVNLAMRCDYMSDLHLEAQDMNNFPLRGGEVLIIAGDLCHARCFVADPSDKYAHDQRERASAFIRRAVSNYEHVLLVVGNHDHYEGRLDQTAQLFRDHLLGVTVLDDEAVEINGVTFYGTTLWSDFEGRQAESLRLAGKGCGEFFFVKMLDANGEVRRFRPADALAAHDQSVALLKAFLATATPEKTVVITHHAPSRKGLNAIYMGNGKDGAYASELDNIVEASGVAFWVHGHTHVIRRYRIGRTMVVANCRGLDGRDPATRDFAARASFEI